MSHKENGNALWFILIAIFLLGGLTVLLSRTGSNTEETGSTERSTINATEIIKYASGMETAVQRLIVNGCSESQLSFQSSFTGVSYQNLNTPSNNSCKLYEVAGGGQTYKAPSTFGAMDILITGESDLNGIGESGCGNIRCSDLYMVFSFKNAALVPLCTDLNRVLGNSTLIPAPSTTYMSATTPFTGTFGPYHAAGSATFKDKKGACFMNSADGDGDMFYFYYVLLAR